MISTVVENVAPTLLAVALAWSAITVTKLALDRRVKP
jgi:hypothetical protein